MLEKRTDGLDQEFLITRELNTRKLAFISWLKNNFTLGDYTIHLVRDKDYEGVIEYLERNSWKTSNTKLTEFLEDLKKRKY